ncbi:phosphopantetheine-binding protein [Streptomyces sp. NPDC006134]|uniref:acyl carrier protein n=1 Tax=Streptomyces sp. NPDC006134 TaxID=3154467 RepID=UPI0033ECFE23
MNTDSDTDTDTDTDADTTGPRTRIAQYLSRFFPVHDLDDDADIFELGFVSSVFAMQLVSFVEDEFGITVEHEDLELDHFRSLSALDAFVTRKLSTPLAR